MKQTIERGAITWTSRGVMLALKDNGHETEINLLGGRSYSINPKLSQMEKEHLAQLLDGKAITEDTLEAAIRLL